MIWLKNERDNGFCQRKFEYNLIVNSFLILNQIKRIVFELSELVSELVLVLVLENLHFLHLVPSQAKVCIVFLH